MMLSLAALLWIAAIGFGGYLSNRHGLGWFLGLASGFFGHCVGVLIMWFTIRAVEKKGK